MYSTHGVRDSKKNEENRVMQGDDGVPFGATCQACLRLKDRIHVNLGDCLRAQILEFDGQCHGLQDWNL